MANRKEKTNKRILSMMLAVAVAFSMGGCNKEDTSREESSEQTTVTETTVETTTQAPTATPTPTPVPTNTPTPTPAPVLLTDEEIRACISEDLEAIAAYHEANPEQALYIDYAIRSDHIVFYAYAPVEENLTTLELNPDFIVTCYSANSSAPVNVQEEIYAGCDDRNTVIVTTSCSWEGYSIAPQYSYDEFMDFSIDTIIEYPSAGELYSDMTPNDGDVLADGIYSARLYVDSFSDDYSAATLTVSEIVSKGEWDNINTANSVTVTRSISGGCIFYDNGMYASSMEATTFAESEFMAYLQGAENGYSGAFYGNNYIMVLIKVENNSIVAINASYWL